MQLLHNTTTTSSRTTTLKVMTSTLIYPDTYRTAPQPPQLSALPIQPLSTKPLPQNPPPTTRKSKKRPNLRQKRNKRRRQNPPPSSPSPSPQPSDQPPTTYPSFLREAPGHQHSDDMTIHNLSTFNLTPHHIQLLTKGLSFSPTPQTPLLDLHRQLLHNFNEYAISLRLKYERAHCTKQRQHHKPTNPTTTSIIYRRMRVLPPPTIESPQQRYTGIAHLDKIHR